MSVTTEADRKLDFIRLDLDKLQASMIEIQKEWGWEDYNREFQGKFLVALGHVVEARRMLL